MKILLFFTCIAAVFFMSCKTEVKTTDSGDSFNLDSVKNYISRSNARFENVWSNGDSATFKTLFSLDGCVYPPTMTSFCGGDLSVFFIERYQQGIRKIKLITNEVFGSGKHISEIGNYQILDSIGALIDRGKYIVIWKNENGSWKMYRDIWNTDRPMANPDGSLPE